MIVLYIGEYQTHPQPSFVFAQDKLSLEKEKYILATD